MSSTWEKGISVVSAPSLKENIEADVLIIGGGITGVTAAYLLAESGKKIVLIDKENLKETVTAYTTAFITCVVDTNLSDLIKMYGEDDASHVWQSGMEAIDIIDANIKREKIECEFMRCPLYTYAVSPSEKEKIEEEAKLVKRMGFPAKIADEDLGIKHFGAYKVEEQAKFHPVKYLSSLKEKAMEKGVLFFDNTKAESLDGYNPVKVKTQNGTISAKHVFTATYEPFNKPKSLKFHQGEYTSYMVEVGIPKSLIKEALYQDKQNPYHYFRLDSEDGEDRLILGGEDHRHELPMDENKAYSTLLEYLEKIMPGMKYTVRLKWSGPILETLDGLPYIGEYEKNKPNLFVATGFSGNGMTYGTIAAKMFADSVSGKESTYRKIYSPLRETKPSRLLRKGLDYTKEFAGGYAKTVFKKPRR
jgi:glycine/D-amino acid oxidase-like deaminating enzyme